MVDRETIDLFVSAGRDLIPLRKRDKIPLLREWTKSKHSISNIRRYAERGFNIGWKLGPRDLIIDVDTRNGGRKSLRDLYSEYMAISSEFYPVVNTGGGGFHFYCTLPPGAGPIRKNLTEYPGIDFLSAGRQVLIPGCVHPSGTPYQWDTSSPYQETPIKAPKDLLERLSRGDADETPRKASEGLEAVHSPEELATLLEALPVEDYASDAEWFPLLCSAHHCTGGEGLAEFLAWSLGDPTYSGEEGSIRARWRSLGRKGGPENLRTVRTLYREVRKHGGEIPGIDSDVEKDFEADFEEAPEEKPKKDLAHYIARLDKDTKPKLIEKVLTKVAQLSTLEQGIYIRDIRDRTKLPIAVLRRTIRELASPDKTPEDLAQEAAELILKKEFKDGETLRYTSQQNFRAYNGRYWRELLKVEIEQCAERAVGLIRKRDPALEFQTVPMMGQIETIFRTRTYVEGDIFCFEETPPSVINLRNGELWIDRRTGTHKLKAHKPESYLTRCLDNVTYNPKSKCPLWLQTLREIFANDPDPEDMIRHIAEAIGYFLQPNKDIAVWFLFYGASENGKTLILDVVSALIGDGILFQSIEEFDTRRNSHALSGLASKTMIIDDDINSRTVLPDGFLKRVSENKTLTANPKFRDLFTFKSHLTPLLAANSFPITKDLSRGVSRRAQLIHFSRTFQKDEQDKQRSRRIIRRELSGILNWSLEGLARLRKRGHFEEPASSLELKERWIEKSNPLAAFIRECLTPATGERVLGREVWEKYRQWCLSQGTGQAFTRNQRSMYAALREMGNAVETGTGNKTYLYGYEIKSSILEDFEEDFEE